MGSLIVDSDVLIDALRGHAEAANFITTHRSSIVLSVITITEIYAGIRGKKDALRIEGLCAGFDKIPVDEAIAMQAGIYRSTVGRSHGSGLGDCIIAATAAHYGLRVVTLNAKHYPMLDNIHVPYKKS